MLHGKLTVSLAMYCISYAIYQFVMPASHMSVGWDAELLDKLLSNLFAVNNQPGINLLFYVGVSLFSSI